MKNKPFLLGARFAWRNKKRTLIAMIGLIVANSIISALFLVSSFQSRVTVVDQLHNQPSLVHIYSSSPSSAINYSFDVDDQLDPWIGELADRYALVDPIIHHKYKMQSTHYHAFNSFDVIFLTPNNTVDWGNLSIPWQQREMNFYAHSDLGSMFGERIISGTLPSNTTGIALTVSLVTYLNMSLGQVIDIGYNKTRTLATGYTITGVVEDGSFDDDMQVVMTREGFNETMRTLVGEPHVILDRYSVDIGLNVDSINIYNFFEFADQVNAFGRDIQGLLRSENLPLEAWNAGESLSSNLYALILLIPVLFNLLVFMAPVVLLSLYLSRFITMELSVSRETDLALLTSRGYSGKQIRNIIAAETMMSSVISSVATFFAGLGLSYVLIPFAHAGSGGPAVTLGEYNPFPNAETFVLFLVLVLSVSVVFNFIVQFSVLDFMLEKKVKTPVQQALAERQRRMNWHGSIITMFLMGSLPIAYQVIGLFVFSESSVMLVLDRIFSVLLVPAPFFLTIAIVKLLADKFPRAFTRLFFSRRFTRHLSTGTLVHRKITSNIKHTSRVMFMIAITTGFGLMVGFLGFNIPRARDEMSRVQIAGDVKANSNVNFTTSIEIEHDLEMNPNVTATTRFFSTLGSTHQEGPLKYRSMVLYHVNMSDWATATTLKEDYLLEGDWASIMSAFSSDQPAILLPAYFRSEVNTTMLDVTINLQDFDGHGSNMQIHTNCPIAGYYKYFPGIYWGTWNPPITYNLYGLYPIILNLNFLMASNPGIGNVSGTDFHFTYIIKTAHVLQADIENDAASLGFDEWYTVAHPDNIGFPITFGLLDDPSIPGLLQVITFACLALALVGYTLVIIMQIYKDRRAIGLFRIRGFQERTISSIYTREHFTPVGAGILIGIACGVPGGMFFLNLYQLDIRVFHAAVNVPFIITPNPVDVILFVVIPILVTFLVARYVIKHEYNRKFGDIMNIAD